MKHYRRYKHEPAPDPLTYGEDVVTLADMCEFEMKPADRPLPRGAYCCGRKAQPIMLAIDNRVEYAIWCSVCDTVWRTGVPCNAQLAGRTTREAATSALYAAARPWADEAAWYIRNDMLLSLDSE